MSIINNVLSKVIGSRNDRLIKKYSGQVAKINALESQMESMSDDELSSITARLKQRAKNNETSGDILPDGVTEITRLMSYLCGVCMSICVAMSLLPLLNSSARMALQNNVTLVTEEE